MDHFNFGGDDWDSIPKMNKKQKTPQEEGF